MERLDPQAGSTLAEVLAIILMMALSMASLAEVFSLDVARLADLVHDSRTAAIATDAATFNDTGQRLLAETAHFVDVSLQGAFDPATAARLREEYQRWQNQADDLERRLEELPDLTPRPQVQRHIGPLLGKLRAIRGRSQVVTRFLLRLEHFDLGTHVATARATFQRRPH